MVKNQIAIKYKTIKLQNKISKSSNFNVKSQQLAQL